MFLTPTSPSVNPKLPLIALFCLLLIACAKTPSRIPDSSAVANADSNAISSDERLGTVWGDEIQSSITEVEATRKTSEPIATTSIHYADKVFNGKKLNSLSLLGGKISMNIITDDGSSYPLVRQNNNYYLSAKAGQNYTLWYQNHTDNTYEIIASVDGLDVINGTSASVYHNGYILRPNDVVMIDGFRKDADTVASFTFGKPEDSYANHNHEGDISNTGIIGTAIYELTISKPKQYAPPPNAQPNNKPNAFPASN